MTQIILLADNTPWTGWKSFSISYSLSDVSHTFELETTDRLQEGLDKWNVTGGTSVEIFIENQRVLAGYAQIYNPDISSVHSIFVRGSSNTIDFVESHHDGSYFWKNVSSEEIIREVLSPYEIDVSILKPMKPIGDDGFRVAVNSDPFNIVKNLCERSGLLVWSDFSNTIIIGDVKRKQPVYIGRGYYTRASATHDFSKLHSEVIVKSQKNIESDDFDEEQFTETRILNPSVNRHRPLIIIHTGDKEAEENFAKYANRRFLGEGVVANFTAKSHLRPDGELWEIGDRVWFEEALLNVNQELIVSTLTFSVSEDSGFEAVIGLSIPEAFSIDGSLDAAPRAVRRSAGFFGRLFAEILND